MVDPLPRYSARIRPRARGIVLVLIALALAGLLVRDRARPIRAGENLPIDKDRAEAARQRINPNTASVASLRRLPGVGPKRAAAIVTWREAHPDTPYHTAEDLTRVHGVGPITAAKAAPYLQFALPPASSPPPEPKPLQ